MKAAMDLLERRTWAAIVAVALLFISLIWGAAAGLVRSDLEHETQDAYRDNANLARAFEEHTRRTLRNVDQIVLFLKYQYERQGRALDIAELLRSDFLSQNGQLLHNIGLIDEAGNLVLASGDFKPANFADRPHFKVHVAKDTHQLFVDVPVIGRLTGKPTIVMTRRINRLDGSFGGVAYASVDPAYFSSFYRQVDLGRLGVVSIVGRDGIVRVRQSFDDVSVGQNVGAMPMFRRWMESDSGDVLTTSAIDGVTRFFSHRTVRDYPLIVGVGTAESEMFANHYGRARSYYWGAGMWSAAILIVATWLVVLMRRRSRETAHRWRAELDLRESEARRASIVDSAMDAIITIDAQHRIVIFNRSAEVVFRCSAREAIGGSLDRFIPALVRATHGAYIDNFGRTGVTSRAMGNLKLIIALRSNGEEFPIEASISHNSSGGREFYTVVIRDITERALQDETLRRFRTAVDATADAIFLVDYDDFRYVDVNAAACRMLGYTREELLELKPESLVSAPRAELDRDFAAVIAGKEGTGPTELWLRRKDDTQVPVEVRRTALRSGKHWLIVSVARDVSERLRASRAIQNHVMQQEMIAKFGQLALATLDIDELVYRAATVAGEGLTVGLCKLMQLAPDGVSLIHKAGYGWGADWIGQKTVESTSQSLQRFVIDASEPVVIADFGAETRFEPSETLRAHGVRSGILVRVDGVDGPFGVLGVYSPNIREFSPESANFLQSVATILAAAIRRRHAEEKLAYLAQFDSLTGLPNQNLFRDRLAQAMTLAKRNNWKTGAVVLDLDNFTAVNDKFGRATGDKVLPLVANRLQEFARAGDSVGHLGGDEFGIVLSHLTTENEANVVTQEICAALSRPFHLEDQEIRLTARLGVSFSPPDADDAQVLLKKADIALFRAKQQGGNNVQFFSEALNADLTDRAALVRDLRCALDRHELEVRYQPQVSLDTGRMVGVEALLRWQHPERGWVSPAQFIPLAEEAGLIIPIGDWVLRTACAQAADWHREGRNLFVSVNVSSLQLESGDFAASVRAALELSGLEARFLELELTESVIMGNAGPSIAKLTEFKAMGVTIAIDDFGTGYSSLSYLKRLPIHTIKIDRAFIQDITSNPDDAAIVRAVIAMAHQMNLKVVAEGVETEEQANLLRRSGCDVVQGFLFSAAVTSANLLELIDSVGAEPLLSTPADTAPSLLLVDDEENNLKALRRVFRLEGYRVNTARSAREAFAILANDSVGVIVSDQRMPEMSGSEFLMRVKSLYPDTVRIVLSGYTDLATVTNAINDGAIYKFLTKPWNDDALRRDIRQAFRVFSERRVPVEL